MEFKIQKNVPVPGKTRRKTKYPFEKMGVGDSFFAGVKPQGLYAAVRKWVKDNNSESRFVVRIESEGSRCWRIE